MTHSAPPSDRSSALEPRAADARAPLQLRCSANAFFPARRHLPTPGIEPCREWRKNPPRKRTSKVAERVLRQETGDDREAQQRQATAATVVGGWLRNYREKLASEIRRIQRAVANLGFDAEGPPVTEQVPTNDARFDALIARISELLLRNGRFQNNERLIVFTEYKTTLDYLASRLRRKYRADRILTLFGVGGPAGMGANERDSVKAAFNDPDAEVRILVATDAASEGLNLHRTARYLLHYDCPWNPSRLEQRNGRLDRYGQARDVTVHHFDSSDDSDVRFLGHVIRKADEIREDLGSANEVFDRAVRRRLIGGEDTSLVQNDLDFGVDSARTVGMEGLERSVATGKRHDRNRRTGSRARRRDRLGWREHGRDARGGDGHLGPPSAAR